MKTERLERLQNGRKTPEQIMEDLRKALIPIVGSPETAERWIQGILDLALVSGGKARIFPLREGEETVDILFPGESPFVLTLSPFPRKKIKEK